MMTNKDRLDEYIERHGLRHTVERDMMLEFIERIDGHFTASELIETFGKQKNVSGASVYRNLKLFAEIGIVTEHRFPSPETVYELATKAATHFHRICTTCGEVKEFKDAVASKALRKHRFRGFEMKGANVYVYGTCKKCKSNKNKQ